MLQSDLTFLSSCQGEQGNAEEPVIALRSQPPHGCGSDSLLEKPWHCLFHIYVMADSNARGFSGRILTDIDGHKKQIYAVDLLPRQENGGFQRIV
jgi:hypothetical protein